MHEDWENEYKEAGYLRKRPNDFFAQFIDRISARKLLLPDAGDVRDAVYAAQYGWGVDAFDPRKACKETAQQLADEKFVSINYETANLATFSGEEDDYDLVALIYPALSVQERPKYFRHIIKYLKSGGRLILEAYARNQPNNPKLPIRESLLYDIPTLKEVFDDLKIEMLEEKELEMSDGQKIAIIHFVGIKE